MAGVVGAYTTLVKNNDDSQSSRHSSCDSDSYEQRLSFFPKLSSTSKTFIGRAVTALALLAIIGVLIHFTAQPGPLQDIKNKIDQIGQALSDAFTPQNLMITSITLGVLGIARKLYVDCQNRKYRDPEDGRLSTDSTSTEIGDWMYLANDDGDDPAPIMRDFRE